MRITDESNNLSITNIIIVAILIKILLTPVIDPIIMTGFIMSLLQYSHKRYIQLKAEQKQQDVNITKETLVTSNRKDIKKLTKKLEDKISEHDEIIERLKMSANFKQAMK